MLLLWLLGIIPISAVTYWLWAKYDWRVGITFASIILPLTAAISGGIYWIGTRQDYFSEVWNYKGVRVEYYEDWNEKVSCRHPKTKTVTHTDSKGNTYTTTVSDGYHHAYDVDDHPEHWVVVDEYGDDHSISKSTYKRWVEIWGGEKFVDMHRSYHTDDGDKYESSWLETFETIYPIEHIATYENRVRVSNSVFNYPEVTDEIKEQYWRPADKDVTNAIISYDKTPFTDQEDLMVRRVNADLGRSNKVHTIVLLWSGDRSVMDDVLAAWKGPNKNELVIAIGVDAQRSIKWCDVYSWCDNTSIHAYVRQDIIGMDKLDFIKIKECLLQRIPQAWVKKDFRDFNYIKNPLPTACYVWYSIAALVVMAASLFFIWKWAEEDYGYKYSRNRSWR